MDPDISIPDVSTLPTGLGAARQIVEEAALRHRRAATAEFFLTQVAHDRPGLVHELAAELSAFGANIEASTQARLGHIGIMMVVVSVESASQQIELLRAVESGRLHSNHRPPLSVTCLRSLGDHLDRLWVRHGDPCALRLESDEPKASVSQFMIEVTGQLAEADFAVMDLVSYDNGETHVFEGMVLPPLRAGADSLELLAEHLTSTGNLAAESGLARYEEPRVRVDPSPYYLSVVGHARVGFVHDILAALASQAISFDHVRMSVVEGRSGVLLALPAAPDRAAVDAAFADLRRRAADGSPRATDDELRYRVVHLDVPDEPIVDRSTWWSCTAEIIAYETTGVIERVTNVLLRALLNIDRMDTRVTHDAEGLARCKALFELSRQNPMSEAQVRSIEHRLRDLDVVLEASVLAARPRVRQYVARAATEVTTLSVATHRDSASIRVDLLIDPEPRPGSVLVDVASDGSVSLKFEVWSEGALTLSHYVTFDAASPMPQSVTLDAPPVDAEGPQRLLMISGGITVWAQDVHT